MYNYPYFIPGYMTVPSSMIRGGMVNNAMNGVRLATQGTRQGLGLFSRLGSGIQAIKKINWGGLINNTSKTLNVVNQAIPLVRQVGPMVNNVRSMLKVASIFKDETDIKPIKRVINNSLNNNNNTHNNVDNISSEKYNNNIQKKEEEYASDNSPTFFIKS